MNNEQQEKVGRFEEFIDQRLKPDLVHAIAERDKVFEQQKIFSDLRRNIENLEKNSVTSLRTLINLGSEVYMQADVHIDEYTQLIASIKVQIMMVYEGIRELLELPVVAMRVDFQLFGACQNCLEEIVNFPLTLEAHNYSWF